MTVEQYKRAKDLGDKILYLKEAIQALETPECKSYLCIHRRYKKDWNGKFEYEPKDYGFIDEDIRSTVLKILKNERDELQKEFEQL